MQKKALLACLLALAMLLTSCSLIKKDAAVDAATEIVRVGDTVFTKGEIQQMVTSYLNEQQSYYHSYYGQNIDITSEAVIAQAQDDVINSLVESTVVRDKAKEMGFDTLNEEEQAEVDDLWKQYCDLIQSMMFSDTELTGDELTSAVENAVTTNFGVTKESLVQSKIQEKLKAEVVKDVTVSEEEIQTEYDSRVENAKTSYASNLSAFGSAYNAGNTYYYKPAGYRLVKQILIKFTDDDDALMESVSAKISSLNSTISSLQKDLTAAEVTDTEALLNSVTVTLSEVPTDEANTVPELEAVTEAAFPEDVSEEVQNVAKMLKENQEKLAYYQNLQTEITKAAYEHIDERADEVVKQLAEGADWDTLMAEKTEDPGMQGDRETAKTGYAICENMSTFDTAFVEAGMALENVGDVSGKVASDMYGYYIVKYVGDIEEGPVALDTVRETIASDLLTTKQDAAYSEAVSGWVSAANAKIDKKALKN